MSSTSFTGNLDYYQSDERPFEKTYGEWTVLWWRWALSMPKDRNPVTDSDGRHAYLNQIYPNVWFLAGKFGEERNTSPHRTLTLKEGFAILFPILNCEANSLEYPELKNEADLIRHVVSDVDTVIKKDCNVNGQTISAQRVKSDPTTFEIYLHDKNPFGVKGGRTTGSADGYWVFLKPLQRGEYKIEFDGSCENGRLCSGARYNLTVM